MACSVIVRIGAKIWYSLLGESQEVSLQGEEDDDVLEEAAAAAAAVAMMQ